MKIKRISKKTRKRIVVTILFLLFIFLLIPIPSPLFEANYATILRAKDGTLLSASISEDEQWRFPPSDSIPEKFETALLLFEDEYFHYHLGINPVSIARAAYQNIRANEIVSGGSTITMQTIRMAYQNKPRTYVQKLIEVAAAVKLELIHSKETILKKYADHAPFGGNIVGLNAAAWRYFGRSPHQLSWAETATLAILPNSPSSIFPGRNHESLLKKRNLLLDKIHSRGLLSDDDLFLSKQEALPGKIRRLPNHAYHLLYRGKIEGRSKQTIHSTLDASLQVRAGEMVNKYSRSMADNQIHNAAAIIVEIESGETRAYVGNSDNPGTHGQHVDIITSLRSPGSLLKPFLYAAALDEGLITPTQLLPDIPIFYKGFSPKNFDKEYRGAVPADQALVSSLNVPFVNLLMDFGNEKFHQKLVEMGFRSFNRPASHYGLSLILGGAETSLWELASVYAGLARASQNFMSRPINKGYSSEDYLSNTYIVKKNRELSQTLSADGFIRVPSIDYALNVLQNLKRPEDETGWEFFASSRAISWKTGTSFGFRDGWAIGMDGKHLVGVWVGNADGEGRPGLTGIRTAAPLLFQLFELVERSKGEREIFGKTVLICKESGMLSSKICPTSVEIQLPEYMTEGKSCSYHQIIHLDDQGEYQVNSSCYEVAKIQTQPWFILPPVQSWYYQKYHANYEKLPPYMKSCMNTEAKRSIDLIYPSQYTKVHIPTEQNGKKGKVIFEAAHENTKSIIYWHLDEEFLGSTRGSHQMGINASKGIHSITLIDESGNEVKQRFEVTN